MTVNGKWQMKVTIWKYTLFENCNWNFKNVIKYGIMRSGDTVDENQTGNDFSVI